MQCDLVLEGGGVKGIALVGAVDVLEEHGYEVQRVAGTSAGAVVGALVAAGFDRDERRRLMRSLDYRRFQDTSRLDRLPGGRLLSLIREQGIYEGKYLHGWMTEQLARRDVRTFADLRLDDPGADVRGDDPYPSRFLAIASDITYGRLRCLPSDYRALGCEDPGEVPVANAVRASMSIPFFYEPVRMPGADGRSVVLVDGGMLSNFPVGVFDRRDGRRPRWPTFGIKLSARPGTQAPRFPGDGIIDVTRAMIGTLTSFYDQMHLDDPAVLARTVFVDTSGVKSTDFDLDEATRDRLYENGRRAAERFLATWDFDAYLSAHRGRADVGDEPAPPPIPPQPGDPVPGTTAV